jgi:NAD(P)-dependent dehydrogenase (short-subunit alcohol dehydrogenase family)
MALNEKVILVTGAAQGIGRGIALRLAADGADIALVDLKADKLEAVKRKLKRSVARRAPSPPTSASGITSMRPSTMPKRNSAASM